MDNGFTLNITRPTRIHPYLQVCYWQLDLSSAKNTRKVLKKKKKKKKKKWIAWLNRVSAFELPKHNPTDS